jgi:predicted permease
MSRVRAMFTARRLDRELDDEVRFHIEMLVQQHLARGASEAEAQQAARRAFGGVTQMKEAYRDQRGLPPLETFVQDARYAVRTLLRTPGFTLAALVTLALGIGANTAIFSVVNAVLLQPLPYEGAERIVEMHRNNGGLYNGHTFVRFAYFKENLTSFERFAAWRSVAFNLVAGDHAEYVSGLAVSQEYFQVFGGTPLYGRTFEAQEDVPRGPDVVVLKHDLWRRLFGSDPAALGQTIALGERSYLIVGIMPDGFDPARAGDFYVPLQPGPIGPGGGYNYRVAARLAPDVTREAANAEAAAAFAAFKAAHPTQVFRNEEPIEFRSMQESLSRDVRPALLLMLGAVGMLLLIACANTANLLLARASARGREMSLRTALGARRGRIIRQLLTESVLLFSTGGVLGVTLACWLVPVLVASTPPGYLPPRPVRIDAVVLVVTMAVSVITGLVFGLAPALGLSRPDMVHAFRDDGARTTGGRRSQWLRRGLVVAEIGLCMLLLVGAGLLIQTFLKLRAVELGFDATNVITARMSLHGERYSKAEAARRYFEQGLARISRIPGVESAAVVNGIPVEYGLNLNFDRTDTPEPETHLTDWRYMTPDYFRALGIEIVQGRGIDERDGRGAARVAVVSEQFARRYYRDSSPIGRYITVFTDDGPIEIVGVARDLREAGLRGAVPAVMYVPVAQASDAAVRVAHLYFQVSWVVRASRLSPELTADIREALRAVDPRQPITAFRSLDEVKARAMSHETFQMTIVTLFATIGLALAAAGIYGLIAYSVAQRAREFGIRMALGATRQQVMAAVLLQGAVLAVGGIIAGLLAASAMTRWLQAFLYEVSTVDLATRVMVGALLLIVSLLASVVPAMRVLRLDPVAALREG